MLLYQDQEIAITLKYSLLKAAQGVHQGKLLKNDKIFTQNVVYKKNFNI